MGSHSLLQGIFLTQGLKNPGYVHCRWILYHLSQQSLRPRSPSPHPSRSSQSMKLPTAAAAESLQSCPTLCDPVDGSPPGSLIPGIPGKNTGVGCHFLLQCTKVKSESEVAQSCPTLSDPMDCSLPGSFIHGIFQARVLEWGAIAFSVEGPSHS